MRILVIAGYYYPETIGSGIWIRQLALDLLGMGHQVSVLTTFPSYPRGTIFAEYDGKMFQREHLEGIDVIRTFTYATPSKRFWPRVASFGSFCASALIGGLFARPQADVVYAILPPLPLGISAWILAKISGARFIVNVQDIYPDIAVAMGVLRNQRMIAFFKAMECWIYSRADRIVVISRGFAQNLLSKGVASEKIVVVPNWADAGAIVPCESDNNFRKEHGEPNQLLVVYSGGLTHNSQLEPLIDVAARLSDEPFRFLVIGEGVCQDELEQRAEMMGASNLQFLPFQPLERYAEILAAADVTVVTLNAAATFASMPSKIYKQMAAARPILVVADPRSEVARLIEEIGCGVCVAPDDLEGLVNALRRFARWPEESRRMGQAGRDYVTRIWPRSRCVTAIAETFVGAPI